MSAEELSVGTRSEVSAEGRVSLQLDLKNTGHRPLYHIHPMFHFHHTMAHLRMVGRLMPGETITIQNEDHPPVRRTGSYPVVAMVQYKTDPVAVETISTVHTDSFHYRKPLPSEIEGRIESADKEEEGSVLRVMLKNVTPAFKNVRLMLLLPPELKSEGFEGIMGFTIRGGEEKQFEIPVQQVSGLPGGQFPVHLLVEYGEMMNHYSGDIEGHVKLGSPWNRGPFWPQLLVFLFLSVSMFRFLRRRGFPAP